MRLPRFRSSWNWPRTSNNSLLILGRTWLVSTNAIQFGFRNVFGWKDKDANGEDDGYSRLPLDQLVETLAVQAKALGLHIDLSYKFHDPARFGGTVEPKLIEGVVKGSEEKKR